MTQACGICNHNKRIDIDRKILQGKSLASLSREYQVSEAALYNHRNNHISRQLATAIARQELHQSLDLLAEMDELLRRTKRIMNKAEKMDNMNLELKAIAEARGSYDLLSKIALSLHQIKVMELEHEARQQEQKNAMDLSVLNERELVMFEKLVSKINKGNPNIVVLKDWKKDYLSIPTRTDPGSVCP